ncbi:pyridoxamine 5'-phosphate oxidase family protein [Natrialba swarupiae]|uniref:Pyridoxamine 5'-phosphate oxidase family protein n=1 Tax=Natrialba swarupiae TaxID=2448032 RepID=A0A5D5AP74_9EURY|nr:pyridoxamine 5'-phosphate oxidase family protein [Natrialba swarupiae]TYT62813.1 pyridoxamine 5'-phosphate oxidase family protein [Natrialba swarupiae]
MIEFRGPWTGDDVETFLQDVRVPIRLATRKPDGSLWIVPLWYRYRDGCFECATGANAHLVEFLRANSDVGFDVSTNEIPYRGVRGSGTATLTADEDSTVLRELIDRYLDGTDSALAERLLDDDREEVRILIEPNRIYSWDYTERMSDVS